MTKEEKPQFSHITIGQGSQTEVASVDEELIVISAVTDADVDEEESTAELKAGTTASDDVTEASKRLEQGSSDDVAVSSSELREVQSLQDLDEEDLNYKMPTIQKIVFILCIVGLIIAIVLVVWFWATKGNVA